MTENIIKLIETGWRRKFTFYFEASRKLKFFSGNTSEDDESSSTIKLWWKQLTDSWSSSNFRWVWCILNEIHDIAQQIFPGRFNVVCDFQRFSGILDGHMNYTPFWTRITKIGFFLFVSSMVTELWAHLETGSKGGSIQGNGTSYWKSEKWAVYPN